MESSTSGISYQDENNPPEDQIVAQLSEIFPDKNLSHLAQVVKEHGKKPIDDIITTISAQDGAPSDFPLAVYKLYEILPEHSLQSLHKEYIRNNCDFESTIHQLVEEQHDSTDPESLATTLSRTLNQPEDVANQYLHQNNNDFIKALIDLVINHVSLDEPAKNPKSRSFSRVQRGGKARQQSNGNEQFQTQMKELYDLYNGSSEMKMICYTFLKKLLICLKGDMNKLIEIVGLIFECRYENLTYQEIWVLSKEEMAPHRPISYSAVAALARPPTISHAKSPVFSVVEKRHNTSKHYNNQVSRAPVISRNYQTTTRLDLHKLLVKEAMSLTRKTIREWWQEEQSFRIEEGKMNQYGSAAQFVSPLEVITGRGIHSEGGVSRIRLQVGKFLRDSEYVYDEESWGYRITGKRRP